MLSLERLKSMIVLGQKINEIVQRSPHPVRILGGGYVKDVIAFADSKKASLGFSSDVG